MAKYYTPAMAKIDKRERRKKPSAKAKADSPGRQAWKRLKRNPTALVGMGIILFVILVGIFAGVIAPYDYQYQDYTAMKQPPSAAHLFGTDAVGRDIFSRCIYGARYSLLISLVSVLCSLVTGGLIGTLAGYKGGKVDNVVMRCMDVLKSIPTVLMALSIVAVLGNGVLQLLVAMTISCVAGSAYNFRTAILTVKSGEYVESSKAINIGTFKMIFRHLIPNSIGVICIYLISMLAIGIMLVSSLSYIGVGIVNSLPEWGGVMTQGKAYLLTYPHMVLFPAGCIMLTVFGFNLFGNGLRDALDPRTKR